MNKEGPATEKERRAWLKAEHGMGMNYAGWIAEQSVGKGDDGNPETYLQHAQEFVENMYLWSQKNLCGRFMTNFWLWDAASAKT